MQKSKLYGLVLLLSLAGYIWLLWNYKEAIETVPSVCFFKKVTGIPCPSCGTTRSIVAIIHGDIAGAIHANPLGFLLILALLVFPLWIIFDIVFSKSSFLAFYNRFERFFKNKWVAIPAIIAILILWIINIIKET